MSVEFYVRYVGAYDGRDRETEKTLVAAGFRRLRERGKPDQFWLARLEAAKGELAEKIRACNGNEKRERDEALLWVKENSKAGQIAVVDEMWGLGVD